MEIEHDVPIPPRGYGQGKAPFKYPFPDMKPGDSLFNDDPREAKSMLCSLYSYARKQGWRIASRRENSGLRIWRTA